jgi:hypothetical protein
MRTPFPFVVGRGRSGTTLMRVILSAHPDMAIPGESPMIMQFSDFGRRYRGPQGFNVRLLADDLTKSRAFRRWGFDDELVHQILLEAAPRDFPDAVRAMYEGFAIRRNKPRYGDKASRHVLHMDKIATLLPESRFVHMIRDGRNVTMSFLEAEFGASSFDEAAAEWNRFVRRGRVLGLELGQERYLEVRYERLVDEPELTVREVCAFLDLDFDPLMLQYYESAAEFIPNLGFPAEHQNLARPPTKGLRDWRKEMTPQQIARFEAIAGDLLDELGYERAAGRSVRLAAMRGRSARVSTEARGLLQHVRYRLKRRRLVRGVGARRPSSRDGR